MFDVTFFMELVAGGEPRKCYAHRVGSVQLGPDILSVCVFRVALELSRAVASNLLERLKSCVLSVLSGKGPHAALETPPGSEAYIHTACPEHYSSSLFSLSSLSSPPPPPLLFSPPPPPISPSSSSHFSPPPPSLSLLLLPFLSPPFPPLFS